MTPFNKFLVFIIFALVIAGQFVPANVQSSENSDQAAVPVVVPTVVPSPTPTLIAVPETLIIPKLGIQAGIDPVSTDFDGKMNMPEDYAKVAWYSPGFKPGEIGNSVIAGHLDKTTGAPALFYNLKDLEPGDEVNVVDMNGQEKKFVVIRKEYYEYDQAPIPAIFGSSSDRNLNLMTCAGWWNAITHNYSQRLVVFTQLKSS